MRVSLRFCSAAMHCCCLFLLSSARPELAAPSLAHTAHAHKLEIHFKHNYYYYALHILVDRISWYDTRKMCHVYCNVMCVCVCVM